MSVTSADLGWPSCAALPPLADEAADESPPAGDDRSSQRRTAASCLLACALPRKTGTAHEVRRRSYWRSWALVPVSLHGPVAGLCSLAIERRHAVEVGLADQHPARLRALVAGDDPAALEHVDQAAGARVADPQAALDQRHRGGLGLDDDLDRLARAAGPRPGRTRRRRRRPSSLELRRARGSDSSSSCSRWARHCSTISAISSSVTYAPWTRCSREVPSGLKSMSPWPSRLSAPPWSRITRESVWLETANAIRRRDVRLDHPGDHVHGRPLRREHEVDADRARLLREADDRVLDLLRRDHHQVGELVDHDEQVRQRLARRARAACGSASGRLRARTVRHALVAALHLADDVRRARRRPASGSRRPA